MTTCFGHMSPYDYMIEDLKMDIKMSEICRHKLYTRT
jgi:hypothetical protein